MRECISYPKRAASSATPEVGIFLLVFVFELSVLQTIVQIIVISKKQTAYCVDSESTK